MECGWELEAGGARAGPEGVSKSAGPRTVFQYLAAASREGVEDHKARGRLVSHATVRCASAVPRAGGERAASTRREELTRGAATGPPCAGPSAWVTPRLHWVSGTACVRWGPAHLCGLAPADSQASL